MVTSTNKGTQKSDAQLAKKAQTTLNGFGVNATYAQCLELLARLGGARTLHVKQAKMLEENVQKLAVRQAGDLMFKSFGSYRKPTAVEVIGAVSEAFALEESAGSRAVEAAMYKIFEEGGVVLRTPYDEVMPFRLPELFWRLVKNLQESIQKQALEDTDSLVLFKGTTQDWAVTEGVSEDSAPPATYSLSVSKNNTAVFVDLGPAGKDLLKVEDSLHAEIAVIVEVNDGVPCVHLANEVYGDVMLSIFSTKEGFLIEPGHYNNHIRTGVVGVASGFDTAAGEVSLSKLQAARNKNVRVTNHAFLMNPY